MNKRLYRSKGDRMLAGVCGGIAEYFHIDPTIVRLIWIAGTIFSLGTASLVYFICAIVIPVNIDGYYYEDIEVYDKDGNKVDVEFKKKEDRF
jgi:phage shock protein C